LFYARKVRPIALAAGAILWIVACQFPAFAQSDVDRIVLSSLIVSIYTFATAREIWTDQRKSSRSHSRWAAICIPVLHGIVFVPPIPLAVMRAGESTLLSSGWIAVFTLETLLYVVGTAFIVLMMAKERAASLYKTEATTDPLTGLLNRRGFMERVELLISRQARGGGRVSLLMFDLDHFKSINDRYGHLAGDAVLAEVGKRFHQVLRTSDLKARYGGEEFIGVLPATSLQGAGCVAETLRRELASRPVPWNDQALNVTASLGVTQAEPDELDIEKIIARADGALYRAKQQGRNRICFDPDSPPAVSTARQTLPPTQEFFAPDPPPGDTSLS